MAVRDVGQLIKMLRESAGIKQNALAKRAGISANYLCQIESSGAKKRPSRISLQKIANALDVPIEIFLENDDQTESASTSSEQKHMFQVLQEVLQQLQDLRKQVASLTESK